ncbi:G-type lectin S-receptor-like serine/threonine-protein kinase SD2-5 [Quercus suber]|uniref:G-type lectin S-receptor-like serine/threonine-protein kinase SD2-5 n=1 Tax=Quercus suber TaxID=58331 RepID=UPI0032DF7945
MGISWVWCGVLLYLVLFLIPFPNLVTALPQGYLKASPSTSWTNSLSAPDSVKFRDGSTVRIILTSGSSGLVFACGFFCNQTCKDYLFAIFFLYIDKVGMGKVREDVGPRVVWSANQKNPVSINATLQLSSERGLVLQDANGTIAWSTNSSSKSVAGINMTEAGNLILLDENDAASWQSFDHPTDSLVARQTLDAGQNLTSEGGLFALSVTGEEMLFSFNSNPPITYYSGSSSIDLRDDFNTSASLEVYYNGLSLYPYIYDGSYFYPQLQSLQYVRLGADGHLRRYAWQKQSSEWKEDDILKEYLDYCDYPMACGNYGICRNAQCSCPVPKSINGTTYFKLTNGTLPDRGCSLVTPLSCDASQNQFLLACQNVTYFSYIRELQFTDLEGCKKACLKVCSCKAAILHSYSQNHFLGDCHLLSGILSLKSGNRNSSGDLILAASMYIKVQNLPRAIPSRRGKKRNRFVIILGSSLASFFGLFLLIGILVLLFRKNNDSDEAEEYYLDYVPGMPTRYSFEDLQAMTKNFSKKLGGGGFGTVFEGSLIDCTKIAVKHLNGINQIKKSFLAEVETIGSIHHFNLVRLIGFCAQRSHRLLVYEYMSNGSLDKWIFHKNHEFNLDWHRRKKIILDIAKGLTYLHEDCDKKIAHLDVKPENILLDENFNAKVADFGLSKLIDRDQSQVVTIMRGTPGYLAPEWLSLVITEKVDVYSFGVVLLEILCGRRHFDRSQPEEAMHLQGLFMEKLQKKQLLDLVDKYCEDMQLHGAEVVDMMRVAAWCLQSDYSKRPSMSMVVKVLEGVMDVEENIDYNFCNPPIPNTRARVMPPEVNVDGATTLLDSVLSGPR